MNDRNRWRTFTYHPDDVVVRWGAFLPPPRGNPEGLIRLVLGIAESGERNAVFRPVRLPGGWSNPPYQAGSESFESYLRACSSRTGRVPMFPWWNVGLLGPALWTPARIAFYRGDAIVEEEIGDVGALLRELLPELPRSLRYTASPVAVEGMAGPGPSSKGARIPIPHDYTDEVRVQFRLDTDIWFPRVMAIGTLRDDDWTPDNRELAQRNTPRLNAFLSEVRQLTLELGGRWEVIEEELSGYAVHYRDMWNDEGILL